MTKEQLKEAIEKSKVHYFREYYGTPHNEYKGTHGQDPGRCLACVSVMVAEINYDGKLYFGVSFRNELDHINRKRGRAIAIGRAVQNALAGHCANAIKFDALVHASYSNEETRDALKYFWDFERSKDLLAV